MAGAVSPALHHKLSMEPEAKPLPGKTGGTPPPRELVSAGPEQEARPCAYPRIARPCTWAGLPAKRVPLLRVMPPAPCTGLGPGALPLNTAVSLAPFLV